MQNDHYPKSARFARIVAGLTERERNQRIEEVFIDGKIEAIVADRDPDAPKGRRRLPSPHDAETCVVRPQNIFLVLNNHRYQRS
jgi:hypothetical protein